jgi:hypothetical protein
MQVREGAVSAIATIIETNRAQGCPEHIDEISSNLSHFLAMCLQSYHGRNFLIALDATEQLAMSCSLAPSAAVSCFAAQQCRLFPMNTDSYFTGRHPSADGPLESIRPNRCRCCL